MTIDLTGLLQAVIALLAALVTRRLIPWIRSRTTRQQQENLEAAARIAVCAAEQLLGAGTGQQKLAWALDALARAGYTVDGALVREAVERAVREFT